MVTVRTGIALALVAAFAFGGTALVTASAADVSVESAKNKKKAFNPKQFAGKWKGKWTNHTFGTSGKSTMDLKAKGKRKKQKFIGTFDLAGTAFGCPDPDPRTVKMKKGKGDNTWSKKGFQVGYDNGFGPISLVYDYKKKKVSGSGTSPCAANITYDFEGKFTPKKLKGDTDIFLDGEPFAQSSLLVKKQK